MSDRIEAEILDVLGEEVAAAIDTPLVVIEGPKGDTGAPGKDGHSPVVTATKSGKTTTISVDGAAIATVEDGADGAPGKDGADGSNGKDGKPGEKGADGAPGIYYGTTQPTGDTHPVWIDPDGDHDDGGLLPAVTAADNGKVLRVVSGAWSAEDMPTGGTDMGITGASVGQIAKITAVDASGAPTAWAPVDMPTALPNPNALTFTGAVTGSYDGSAPLSVEIPSGGGSGGGSAFSPQLIANLVADGTTTSILQNIDVAYPAIYTVSIIGSSIADAENKGQYLYAKFGASDMYANAVDVRGIQTVNNNYTQQFVAITIALDSEKRFHVIGKAENNASNTTNWMSSNDGTKISKNAIIFYSSTSKIIPAGFTCSVWRWA